MRCSHFISLTIISALTKARVVVNNDENLYTTLHEKLRRLLCTTAQRVGLLKLGFLAFAWILWLFLDVQSPFKPIGQPLMIFDLLLHSKMR